MRYVRGFLCFVFLLSYQLPGFDMTHLLAFPMVALLLYETPRKGTAQSMSA